MHWQGVGPGHLSHARDRVQKSMAFKNNHATGSVLSPQPRFSVTITKNIYPFLKYTVPHLPSVSRQEIIRTQEQHHAIPVHFNRAVHQ